MIKINESYYKRLYVNFDTETEAEDYAKKHGYKDYRITGVADPLNRGKRIFNIEIKED